MRNELDALFRRYDGHTPGLMGAQHRYAVLCSFVEIADDLHLLFEVRAAGLRQGGEVCFPGGRVEKNESVVSCAVRETEEELAIPASEITVFGTPDFICNQRGFILQPVLGLISSSGFSNMRPSPAEVAEVFTVPVSFFKNTPPERYSYRLVPQVQPDFPYESVGIPRDYPWVGGEVDVPVWHYQGHVIWGMTARIVHHLICE